MISSRLARRGGVYRIKKEIYDEIRVVLKERLSEVRNLGSMSCLSMRAAVDTLLMRFSYVQKQILRHIVLVMESGTIPSCERKVSNLILETASSFGLTASSLVDSSLSPREM